MSFAPSVSYHPADALHVESAGYPGGYDRSRVVLSDEALYQKEIARGDVEIGIARAYGRWLAVSKQGKVLELVAMSGAKRGVIERDGEIHVMTYAQGTAEDTGMEDARWSAIAVAADGSVREDVVMGEGVSFPWATVSDFADKRFDSFGLRGATPWMSETGQPVGKEITWRWDRKGKVYVGKVRSVPLPASPKGKGKKR